MMTLLTSTPLPPLFLERMQRLLGVDYESFLRSYEFPRYTGIRVNTLKIDVETFQRISPFGLKPIPWCPTGFYVDPGEKPGKHPYYHAGLYYIQEPSAMAPVELLEVNPGERVLDLCAAPGGKSTQIATKLQGNGLLVTNDISADRTKALAKNMELYGVRNAVVLNETPAKIAQAFPHFFDKVLIDAPCSGEGMFRKDEHMARQWETHSTAKCTIMQWDILQSAAELLAPGGRIVYSTCTFAPEENEGMIAEFLSSYPEFEVVTISSELGFSPGRPDWLDHIEGDSPSYSSEISNQTAGCARLWPHLLEGEGHFLAVLKRKDNVLNMNKLEREHGQLERRTEMKEKPKSKQCGRDRRPSGNKNQELDEQQLLQVWRNFARADITMNDRGNMLLLGQQHVYLSPLTKEQLHGLKTVRSGWYVGSIKNGRFSPSHPLATALGHQEATRVLTLSLEDDEVVHYLKGETLQIDSYRVRCKEGAQPKGYVLVMVGQYSLGWAKWLDGLLKNEYPAGWRWT